MARSFNGTNQNITPNFAIVTATSFSFAAWVQNNSSATGNRTILTVATGGFPQTYLRIGDAANNKPEFGYWDGSTNHRAVGASVLSTSTWYQLAGTYDGTTYKIYVNGTVATTADAVAPSFTSARVTIGSDGGSRWWIGPIADVAIWNVALTTGEALALTNGARPYTIRPLSLQRFWPIDGLQSPEPDLSGNKDNGTLAAAPPLAAGPPFMPFTPRWPQFLSPPPPPPVFILMPQIVM